MEYAMTEKEYDAERIRQAKNGDALLASGWVHCSMRPEFRGPDFPGTEDYPTGWFRGGTMVSCDGTVHHSVEPHHIEQHSFRPGVNDRLFSIIQAQ